MTTTFLSIHAIASAAARRSEKQLMHVSSSDDRNAKNRKIWTHNPTLRTLASSPLHVNYAKARARSPQHESNSQSFLVLAIHHLRPQYHAVPIASMAINTPNCTSAKTAPLATTKPEIIAKRIGMMIGGLTGRSRSGLRKRRMMSPRTVKKKLDRVRIVLCCR